MKTLKTTLLFILLGSIFIGCAHTGKIYVKVIDENGDPVEHATVQAGYSMVGGFIIPREICPNKSGQTDHNGLWVFTGVNFKNTTGAFGAIATKDGFSETQTPIINMCPTPPGLYLHFPPSDEVTVSTPTNPVIIQIKKKLCLIPAE